MVPSHLEKLRVLTNELNQKDKTSNQTEKILNCFFDQSIDLLSVSNFSGGFLKLNPAWQKVLGWTLEDLLSNPQIEFIHPDDIEDARKTQQILAEGNEVTYFRNRYRCKDGSYKILCWTAYPDLQNGMIYATARDFSAMMDAHLV